jgi:hypothetical protein
VVGRPAADFRRRHSRLAPLRIEFTALGNKVSERLASMSSEA